MWKLISFEAQMKANERVVNCVELAPWKGGFELVIQLAMAPGSIDAIKPGLCHTLTKSKLKTMIHFGMLDFGIRQQL